MKGIDYNKEMEQSIKTRDGVIAFSLVRRNMKHIRIRVTGEQRVVVSAPRRCGQSVIDAFVRDSEAFIRRQLAETEARRARCYPVRYEDGDTFSLLGQRALLSVTPAQRASAVWRGGVLELRVPPGGSAKEQFIRWTTRQARAVFADRMARLSSGFPDADNLSFGVKRMLTRWGSINPARKRMSLSVHLMRCETELIDYVIRHELCHLRVPGHSAEFYRALSAHCPNWAELDKRLEAYGLVDF